MSISNEAIGGYFELETHSSNKNKYHNSIKYQSARAAFFDLLKNSPNIKRIFMPSYICDSMLKPIQIANKEIFFYDINENLQIHSKINLSSSDLLLYANYFGIHKKNCNELIKIFDSRKILLDFSQAFYEKPKKCYATIYSPRKFFGIPDGGLLLTSLKINPPKLQDTASKDRIWHLIKRLDGNTEDGYQDFKNAEESLNNFEPRLMSNITQRLLQAINFESIRIARNKNFSYLRKFLDKTNILHIPPNINGPHCYPYLPANPVQKNNFIKNKIYIATYWPDVLSRVKKNSFEATLVSQCLPIPCDQRYNESHLNRILDLVL